MKLFYYSDGEKILVHNGDDFLATPIEAMALEADLVFAWHKEAAHHLLGAWKHMGVGVVECSVKGFKAKGGVFAQAAKFYELHKNS
jgi:hypothetical protein